jgi:hypothetical protein
MNTRSRSIQGWVGGGALLGLVAVTWGANPPRRVGFGEIRADRLDAVQLVQEVNAALDVSNSRVQELTIAQRAADSITTPVEINGQPWTLVLTKKSIRSPDFQVLVQVDQTGVLLPVEAPPVITYKGYVEEQPGAEVRASFQDGKLNAIIYTLEGNYGIQPLSELGFTHAGSRHAVYKASDWINKGDYTCGTDEARHRFAGADRVVRLDDSTRGTGLKIADIGVDADFEYYQLNASSVSATVQDMEIIINGVETIYENECGITYELTTAIVRTVEPDPYTATDPGVLLTNQFQANWNSSPQSFIRRDLAHLFTGKNIDGSVIGIAYLGVVCNTGSAYGLVQSRFTGSMTSRIALSAHEIGHNWNAPHCNDPPCSPFPSCCDIMCSGLGGCSGQLATLDTFSANQIIAFKNTRFCLSDLADPQTLPFFDDFPSTTLSTAKWSYSQGGAITTTAMNEPSAPNSFELDAVSSELYRDDDLRTNFIQLAGQANARLSYYTQHRGVENGEQLVVEYWSNSNQWLEINRLTSDGVDQTTFDFNTHILPANAQHNEFRVRFRSEVTTADDDWFLDDVTVSTNCTLDTDCNDNQFCNGEESCVGNICLPGTAPCPGAGGPLCSELLDRCVECLNPTHCTDGIFCNGTEVCDSEGICQGGGPACPNAAFPFCLEASDQCVECLTATDCDDGVFCNGVEPCTSNACGNGSNPCVGLACNEENDACQPPAELFCVLANASATAGSTVSMDVYAEDVVNSVRSYQARVAITPTSGSGSTTINCPGGVVITDSRSDFIFFGLSDLPASNCSLKQASSALLSGSTSVGSAPVYLGTFLLTVSPDATVGSTFDLSIVATSSTYLRDANNTPLAYVTGPVCTLSVADCNPCQLYGDVFPFNAAPIIGDCAVDVGDVICVADGFGDSALCPFADIAPCGGDGTTDVGDVLAVVDAFGGNFACPDPCP